MSNPLNYLKPAISLRGVSVELQGNRILDSIDLDVPSGQVLALLGPSGCGKTTMLRVIAGLQATSTGKLLLGGTEINDVPPYRRGVGMVFQNYALFPHMTVADNIVFGLRMQKLPADEQNAILAMTLDMMGLTALKATYPARLSGGQQQRVAVARTIATRPAVLLLDEPLSALDKKLKDNMRAELRDLLKKVGITAIIVTHDQEEALAIADRVAVMNQGRIAQIGEGRELYDKPKSRFVADFVGHMNYIRGTITGMDKGLASVETSDGDILTAPADTACSIGDDVEIAIRPEMIRVKQDEPHEADGVSNSISAQLVGEEFLGVVSYVRFKRAENQQILVISVGKERHDRASAEIQHRLSWPIEATSLMRR